MTDLHFGRVVNCDGDLVPSVRLDDYIRAIPADDVTFYSCLFLAERDSREKKRKTRAADAKTLVRSKRLNISMPP